MAFKIKPFYTINNTPVTHMPMEDNVMGRADKKGNILLNKDMKNPKDIKDTINHEQVHIDQMKRGELYYDEQAVYFKGKKYLRKEFDESNKKLPWEAPAYKAG
tara:strand:- start:99 stop:407 length:309 start_codon:yes stop_codon:yes gene_type:complete